MLSVRLVVASLALMCVWAPAAWATFPGRNGALVLSSDRYDVRLPGVAYALTLVNPGTGHARRMELCSDYQAGGPVAQPLCEGKWAAAVSPDGRRIAFVMDDGLPDLRGSVETFRLSVVPFDGGPSVKHPLIAAPGDPFVHFYEGPRWSPDGSRLALVRDIDGDVEEITFVRTNGHLTGRAITRANNPDWSPDGRIVFERDPLDAAPDHFDLYVGKPSGPFRRLTRKGGTAGSWSPDGRRIAFVRNGGIYVVPSRGGQARRIVKPGPLVDTFGGPRTHAYEASAPVWSPDGKQIAFLRAGYLEEIPRLYKVGVRTKRARLTYSGIQPTEQVSSLDWRPRP